MSYIMKDDEFESLILESELVRIDFQKDVGILDLHCDVATRTYTAFIYIYKNIHHILKPFVGKRVIMKHDQYMTYLADGVALIHVDATLHTDDGTVPEMPKHKSTFVARG